MITVAPTREEAEDHLIDALREYMMAGEPVQDESDNGIEVAGLRVAVGL